MSITPEQPTDKTEPTLEVEMAAEKLTAILGDPAAGDMIRDLVAGTVNRTIGAMAPTFGKVFATQLGDTLRAELSGVHQQMTTQSEQLAEAIQAISTVDRRIDLSNSRTVDRWAQMQEHIDARFDNFGVEIDGVSTQIGGLRDGQADLQKGFLDVREHVDELRLDVAETRKEVAQVRNEQARMWSEVAANGKLIRAIEKEVGDLHIADAEGLNRLEQLEKGNITLGKRIDALTKVQAAAQERQREIEDRAAVGVMSGEERARLMRWFQENAGKLQALIDAQEQQGDG